MRTQQLDIVGSTRFDRYKKQSIEATYNMIISDNALVPYAGYKKVLDIIPGMANARQLYRTVKKEKLIAVIDDSVFLIGLNLSVAFIGGLETQAGPVYIAENNADQIGIVDGLFVYIYNTDTQSFQRITVGFQPDYIDFQDTYFIAVDGSSNQWHLSEQNNGTSWPGDAQHVGELETKPDVMVAAVRFDRQLFVMGRKTTEIWHDVGARLFPYQRDNSLSIDYGCINAATIASGFGLLVWVAVNEKAGPTILVSTGGAPRQLSTDGINFLLDKLKNPADATGFLFEEDGHVFYQLTFRSDNTTLVYDFNTEKFFNITDDCLNAHIANRIAFFANTHYFLSNVDGSLYELSTDFLTAKTTLDDDDLGAEIPRIRVTAPFRLPDASRYALKEISVTTEMGNAFIPQEISLLGNIEKEQIAQLSLSKDGGETFGTSVRKNFNFIGNRTNRLRWLNLGSANDTTFQFRFYGKFRFVVVGATLRWEQ